MKIVILRVLGLVGFMLIFTWQNCSQVGLSSPAPDTNVKITGSQVYNWALVNNACSQSCGPGTETPSVFCEDGNGVPVADSLCAATKPTPTAVSCQIQVCGGIYQWALIANMCSQSCGPGTQTPSVVCVDSNHTHVSDSLCTTTKPIPTPLACQIQACSGSFQWKMVAGACSQSCGPGTQTPVAVCVDASGNQVADGNCTSPKPTYAAVACQIQACQDTYQWTTSLTGSCTPSNGVCGPGTQLQTVTCMDVTHNTPVADSFCNPSTKPNSSVGCPGTICPAPKPAAWYLYPTATPLYVPVCPFIPANWAPADGTIACAGYEGQFCDSSMAYYQCR